MSKPIIKTATAYDHKRLDRITPIPGAVWRDRKWTVKGVPAGGRTLARDAMMEVDHTETARGDYTRAHEMVHTVISPEGVPTENSEAYVVLEEAQVHAYMKQFLDLPKEAYESHEEDKRAVFERAKAQGFSTMTRRQRAILATAIGDELNINDRKRIYELLDKKDADILMNLMERNQHYLSAGYTEAEHENQREIAARFDLAFTIEEADQPEEKEGEDESEDESEGKSKGKSKSKGEGEEEDEGEEEGKKPAVHKSKSGKSPESGEKQKEDYARHKEPEAKWGPMEIEKPPLTIPSKALRLLQKRRLQDTGSHITRITRIVSDGFIFGEKHRVQGGTVLVDTSGSMRITVDQMKHLLDTAPAATVAIYAQAEEPRLTPARGRYEEYGILRVVVDKGRMAEPAQLKIGSGNLVDGPALEWLAKMPEPRFWISDGYVIGSNGSGIAHVNFCANVCKRNRIVRLNDIPSAIERLTGRKETKSA